ncbi:MAG TPA: hypothetical protein VH352_24425 [Pseudonocardiaceae bacterium]|nr:hypothetical protein [Pseudonocardiaceae bacterium]
MSWEDFYQRRDAIELVLAHAGQHPGAGLPFEELTPVRLVFADRESLALALQYKWSLVLTGRIGAALTNAERTPDIDQVEAVAAAWRTAARQQPALRDLLDGYTPEAGAEFHRALQAEQRMVAFAAGLAEPGEPADETARIGSAFLALVRSTPRQPVNRRTSPVEQLFRRLVASS